MKTFFDDPGFLLYAEQAHNRELEGAIQSALRLHNSSHPC